MDPIVELARAKINLTLRILGRRPDGYHELESLVTFADVGDVITLDPDRPPGVSVAGPFAAAIVGENLALRALTAVPGLRTGHIHIEKILPVSAGIGGGSADAAAVLRALRRLNGDRARDMDWSAVALGLGADVPACLISRPLVMSGIGERIRALEMPPPPLSALLVTPAASVPPDKTRQVFRALAAPALTADRIAAAAAAAAAAGTGWSAGQPCNDLEAPACRVLPELAAALAELRAMPGLSVHLSGAGPTLFIIADGRLDAVADAVRRSHPDWWIAPARLG